MALPTSIHQQQHPPRKASPRRGSSSSSPSSFYYWTIIIVILKPLLLVLIGVCFGYWMGSTERIFHSFDNNEADYYAWIVQTTTQQLSKTGTSAPTTAAAAAAAEVIPSYYSATAGTPVSHEADRADIGAPEKSSSNETTDSCWTTIHVYIGKADFLLLLLDEQIDKEESLDRRWFSQARQDELVVGLFSGRRNGYFVDLAANDAVNLSNTFALQRTYGWTGLCIEPNPMYWSRLAQRGPSCQVVGAVVGGGVGGGGGTRGNMTNNEQPVPFRFQAGPLGGIVGDGFDNGKRWMRESELVYTVPLLEIFQRHHVPFDIDYLSLDVEGAESLILLNFPLNRYRIKVITGERLHGPIRKYLKDHGFDFMGKLHNLGESLWIHQSAQASLNLSVIDEFRV